MWQNPEEMEPNGKPHAQSIMQHSLIRDEPKFGFFNRTRYAIMVITIICLAWLMGNSLILNFTIICMTDETDQNSSTPGISTLLTPLAAFLNFWVLFAMRFLEGFALAVNYPVLGAIVTRWSPLAESGLYTAWLSCNLQFGAMFTMPVSSQFCVSQMGWEGVFYLQGALTIISMAAFYVFFRDNPREHRFVTGKELKQIEGGKTSICEKKVQPVPYMAIFKSLPIWGVWICCVGGTMGYQIFVQYGPVYLNKALNFEIINTGFLTAIANLASCFIKIIAGPLSDLCTFVSPKNRVKLFTIISQGVLALSFVCLALVPSHLVLLAEIAYVCAVAFSGLMWVGAVKSGTLVAQQHAHFILAVISFINSAGILILPPFVEIIAPDNTPQQWSVILYIICGCVIMCTGLFAFVGEGEPAWWTKPEYGRQVHEMS